MKDGVILVNKEAGMTSFDVVAVIRRIMHTRQVGHTGTLDPMATGLLPVMIGRAVKASEYLSSDNKSYEAVMLLGVTTDTEDVTGNVLSRAESVPDFDEVKKAASCFVGQIYQVPPMYSALKKDGKKLCDLARQGITGDSECRPGSIYSLDVMQGENENEYVLSVSCSKGTYIRTLCADIGKTLGCGAVMSALKRTKTGGFSLEDAHTLSEIEEMSEGELERNILDTESLFSDCEKVVLPPFFAHLAKSGCEIYQKKIGTGFELGQKIRMYDSEGFFSLGEVKEYEDGSAIKPIKKFRIEQ